MSDRYPCPCCGHRVLGEMPGSYEICPVCFWELGRVYNQPPFAHVGPAIDYIGATLMMEMRHAV
ncbi:CPCC family cysteine-rich protein, partial [Streptomyces sp. NPDC001274]